jgi:hypothetical protein
VKTVSTKEFIKQSRRIHGNRYDYSKTQYVNSKVPVTIVCRKHGPFSQIPYNHLTGRNCRKCASNRHLSGEEQVQRFRAIHGHNNYAYDLSELRSNNNKHRLKVTCIHHGPFTVTYHAHLKKAGCPQCTKHYQHLAGLYFEQRARAIHGDKYTYGQYVAAAKKMEITCPKHGLFMQTPASHLQQHGCPGCADERKRLLSLGGYSEAFFALHKETKQWPAILYLIEFRRPGERFLKVGITRTSVRARFKSGYRKYQLKLVASVDMTLYEAFYLEQELLTRFKKFQVFPKQNHFVGKTECLASSCSSRVQASLEDVEHGCATTELAA